MRFAPQDFGSQPAGIDFTCWDRQWGDVIGLANMTFGVAGQIGTLNGINACGLTTAFVAEGSVIARRVIRPL